MSAEPGRLGDYLSHIHAAIERIRRYTAAMNAGQFIENECVQDAVIRNFEIIGEASRNVEKHYPAFASAHPELPLLVA